MFALTYARARADFLAAAQGVNATVHSMVHPLKGKDGETLALDVAVVGNPNSPKRILLSSGCHGVEGFCGSGIQIATLKDQALLQRANKAGVTFVFAHALNPHGFSFVRRVTEDNVDLNRNFLDFNQPLPVNLAYEEFHHLLMPKVWPPDESVRKAMTELFETKGMPYAQAAVSGGQNTHPDGLHYSGLKPTWSNLSVRQLLREHCASAKHLAWIDLHTGLGPSGHGERIMSPVSNPADITSGARSYNRAKAWWSGDGKTPVTSFQDGSSSSAKLSGTMGVTAYQECPNTEVTKMALEYGTHPLLTVMHAMRAEQWLQMHPEAPAEQQGAIKQAMMDAFFTNTPLWRQQVTEQCLEALHQSIEGLSNAGDNTA
jgi:Protein of unknown function (DUF2817)